MKKSTQKKGIFAVVSAFVISVMKDPIKRKMAFSFGKKALNFFKKSSKKSLKK